jgi:ribose 5-phosphate isomerase RpiB
MNKIYQDAKDKYVTAVIVYGKAADSKIYVDAEYSEQVDQAVVEDAFDKGVLMVKVGTASFRPVKIAANKVTVVDLSSGTVSATEFSAKAAG